MEELLKSEVWPDLQVHILGEDGTSSLVGRMAKAGTYELKTGNREESDGLQ